MIHASAPVVVLFLFALMLHRTRGHYDPVWIFILPLIWVSFFIPSWKGIKKLNEPQLWTGLLGTFCLVNALSPELIYVENRSAWIGMKVSFGLLFLVLCLWYRNSKTNSTRSEWWFSCFLIISAIAYMLVISASPNPRIDIWVVAKEAVHALVNGVNPYTQHYTHIYSSTEVPYESFFGYPPTLLFWYVPWEVIFGDVRFGWVFAHLLTGWLLRFAARSSGCPTPLTFLIPACYLTFPIMPFVIEQSWVDPFGGMCLATFLIAYQNRRWLWMGTMMGLLISAKQNYILLLPFLGFATNSVTNRSEFVNALAVTLAIPALIILPFWIWSPAAFSERVLWFLGNNTFSNNPLELFVRKDALSFVAWAAHQGYGKLPALTPWILYALFIWPMIQLRATQQHSALTFLWMSFILSLFFAFSNWAFCNYYWFCTLGVWMASVHGPLRKSRGVHLSPV